MSIVGHGIDIVDVARFEEHLVRTPGLRERLFTPAECAMPANSLAVRFAAKEALIKALGGSDGLRWTDIEIPRAGGRPEFVFSGETARTMIRRGLRLHLSLSHDGGFASASVIAESP